MFKNHKWFIVWFCWQKCLVIIYFIFEAFKRLWEILFSYSSWFTSTTMMIISSYKQKNMVPYLIWNLSEKERNQRLWTHLKPRWPSAAPEPSQDCHWERTWSCNLSSVSLLTLHTLPTSSFQTIHSFILQLEEKPTLLPPPVWSVRINQQLNINTMSAEWWSLQQRNLHSNTNMEEFDSCANSSGRSWRCERHEPMGFFKNNISKTTESKIIWSHYEYDGHITDFCTPCDRFVLNFVFL